MFQIILLLYVLYSDFIVLCAINTLDMLYVKIILLCNISKMSEQVIYCYEQMQHMADAEGQREV